MASSYYKKAVSFAQTVNEAVVLHDIEFNIYRTIEGAVQKIRIVGVTANIYTGQISISYKNTEGEIVTQPATELDLKLISQLARQYQAEAVQAQQAQRAAR